MTRMSGQSCVREQGTGAKGSGRSSVITGVSFSAGKKVSRSHKCPPSSSSSLTSAATSHKSLGSVRMKIHFPTEHNESIQKNKLNNQVSSLPASLSDLFLPTSDMSGLIPSIPSACCKNIWHCNRLDCALSEHQMCFTQKCYTRLDCLRVFLRIRDLVRLRPSAASCTQSWLNSTPGPGPKTALSLSSSASSFSHVKLKCSHSEARTCETKQNSGGWRATEVNSIRPAFKFVIKYTAAYSC